MKITLSRIRTNHLYTLGTLSINGRPWVDTIEHTPIMLPTGCYQIHLSMVDRRRLAICIEGFTTIIDHGNSWKDARRDATIIIGRQIIEGCVCRSQTFHYRLMGRLKKGREPIVFSINDRKCVESLPIGHWLHRPSVTPQSTNTVAL